MRDPEIDKEMNDILAHLDHTSLRQTATWDDIERVCDEGVVFHTATICIPPCYVKRAKAYIGEKVPICTVIGFPNGYQSEDVKEYETKMALSEGAEEIDMVINLGDVKESNFDKIGREIERIKKVCGDKILKVIIETCLLKDVEKVRMCQTATVAGCDYLKTSTGFSTGGATLWDVKLLKEYSGREMKVKAAGGIKTLEEARAFLDGGADRIGSSHLVDVVREYRYLHR